MNFAAPKLVTPAGVPEDDVPLGVAGLELHAESSLRTSTTPAGGPEAPPLASA
jgi:hypothetical protein